MSATIIRSAEISEDKKYRWWLHRDWSVQGFVKLPRKECVFVGLNPSTANHLVDDPTVRVWISFAKRWALTGFWVVNLYPFRTTYPNELPEWWKNDPTRRKAMEHNLRSIEKYTSDVEFTVVCWGDGSITPNADIDAMYAIQTQMFCLSKTKAGNPHHPRGLRLTTPLEPFP